MGNILIALLYGVLIGVTCICYQLGKCDFENAAIMIITLASIYIMHRDVNREKIKD